MSRAALARFLAVREFTGLHMLIVMVAFFGVTIAVNLTMAVLAATSWTGLLAKNGYVASIDYAKDEAQRHAAAELGWSAVIADRDGIVALTVHDAADDPVRGAVRGIAEIAGSREDAVALSFQSDKAGRYVAERPLPPGRWVVRSTLSAGGAEVTWRSTHHVRAPQARPEDDELLH